MHPRCCPMLFLALLLTTMPVRAGLHYSGEIYNPLPAKWQGMIMDHRVLRVVSRPATKQVPASPLRLRYQAEVRQLEEKGEQLTADELADLGALHVRLGNINEAVVLLRVAQKRHPEHFRIHSNLATAWQLQGNLALAAASLQQALRFAPEPWKEAEKLHLKLIRSRQREKEDADGLDDLFGLKFVDVKDEYVPGRLPAEQRRNLPKNAVALVQQLALWLPADGRLLWLMAELTAIHGNVRLAAAMMDGCVTELGMREPELRRRRQAMRTAAEELLKQGPTGRAEHERHALKLKTESSRPLANRFFKIVLPPIKPDGINPLPWEVITQTSVDRKYRPTFPKYLEELDGKQVKLQGYIQPLGMDLEMTSFLLIEYPVGCWYCEIPEIIAMIYVELPEDKLLRFSREMVEVTGTLSLNRTDPEDFLYSVRNASAVVGGE